MWLKKVARSFPFAFAGVAYAIRTQRNMRIHLIAAGYAVWLGILVGLEPEGWASIALCCGGVMALELVNTALEALCDRVTRSQDEAIRVAKDAAAGAVLLMAIASVCVAGWLFVPWLWSGGLLVWLKQPLFDGALVLSLGLAVLFVRGKGA